MSVSVSNSFIASFATDVKLAYQSQGSGLNSAVRVANNVKGSTHTFYKIAKGLATPRTPQADVTPMNVVHSNVTATLANWNAAEYSDILDLEKISFDEKSALVKTVAGGLNRGMEQLVIAALDAGANSTQVSVDLGGTASGLNVAKLRRAKKLMDAAGVPMVDRYFAHDASALEQLLGATQATSADFNNVRALVSGDINTFLGFRFIMIEDRSEGGIPVSSTTVKNFAFHKDAIGLAIGHNISTEINYIPEKTSWLINGMFSAGAIAIDNTGIYEVLTNNAAVV